MQLKLKVAHVMLLNKPLKPAADDRHDAGRTDEHWLLADLEAAQRRNLYAAGRGDGPGRTSPRWSITRRVRRAEHHI
jgi:hypothetical protein